MVFHFSFLCLFLSILYLKGSKRLPISNDIYAYVQEVYKRKQLIFVSILLGEFVNCYCIVTYYIRQMERSGKNRVDLLLYRACLGKGWSNINEKK